MLRQFTAGGCKDRGIRSHPQPRDGYREAPGSRHRVLLDMGRTAGVSRGLPAWIFDVKNELVGYLTKSRLLSVLSRQYQDSVRQKDGILA